MRYQTGQSVTEYGLILALIAVAAIPAVSILGDSVKGGLNQQLSGLSGDTSKVASGSPLVTPTPSSATPATPPTGGIVQSSTFKASYNPKTGKVTYSLPETNGGGTSTASVEGATMALSQQLKLLANTYVSPTGKPMPSELKEYINDLATSGVNLSKAQSDVVSVMKSMDSMDNSVPLLGSSLSTVMYSGDLEDKQDDVHDNAEDFVDDYKDLSDKIKEMAKDSPELASLQATIDAYAGIISYVNYSNFIPTAGKNSSDKKLLVGTDPAATTSVQDSPQVTYDSAQGIKSTTKTAP